METQSMKTEFVCANYYKMENFVTHLKNFLLRAKPKVLCYQLVQITLSVHIDFNVK